MSIILIGTHILQHWAMGFNPFKRGSILKNLPAHHIEVGGQESHPRFSIYSQILVSKGREQRAGPGGAGS